MNTWIERYRRRMQSKGYSNDTVRSRTNQLYRMDRELPLGLIEATVEELEDWLAGPTGPDTQPWSLQTKASYRDGVVGFYRFAADPARVPHLSYDPSVSLARPRVPKTVPRPCATAKLEEVLDRLTGRVRVYCLIARYAGLRACQIAALDREDVTEQVTTVRGKGGKDLVVPTHPEIWRAVKDFPPGPIARRRDGARASANYVSVTVARAIRRLFPEEAQPARRGGRGRRRRGAVTLHPMRHWFATWLLTERELGGAGANLRTVQELLGHADPASTAIYTQVTDEQRRLAVNALPTLAPTTW